MIFLLSASCAGFHDLRLMLSWVRADDSARFGSVPNKRSQVDQEIVSGAMHAATEYMSESTAVSTRRHQRSLFSVPFELRQLAGPAPYPLHAISLDISEGGLGALVQGNLKIGEAVQVDLPLAEKTIHIVAVVRHTSALRSGFEFLRLSETDRRDLSRAIGSA